MKDESEREKQGGRGRKGSGDRGAMSEMKDLTESGYFSRGGTQLRGGHELWPARRRIRGWRKEAVPDFSAEKGPAGRQLGQQGVLVSEAF